MKPQQITIPHRYQAGKSTRKITTNAILSMHWRTRKRIHDQFQTEMSRLLGSWDTRKEAGYRYRIALGFYAGKSTKTVDIDNMYILLKWAIDVWRQYMGIDDNIHVVVETSCVYLGKQADEQVIFQVVPTLDITGHRPSPIL